MTHTLHCAAECPEWQNNDSWGAKFWDEHTVMTEERPTMFATNTVVSKQGGVIRVVFENNNRLVDVTMTGKQANRLLKELAMKLGVAREAK